MVVEMKDHRAPSDRIQFCCEGLRVSSLPRRNRRCEIPDPVSIDEEGHVGLSGLLGNQRKVPHRPGQGIPATHAGKGWLADSDVIAETRINLKDLVIS